jgi:hypothetical protein
MWQFEANLAAIEIALCDDTLTELDKIFPVRAARQRPTLGRPTHQIQECRKFEPPEAHRALRLSMSRLFLPATASNSIARRLRLSDNA